MHCCYGYTVTMAARKFLNNFVYDCMKFLSGRGVPSGAGIDQIHSFCGLTVTMAARKILDNCVVYD